MIHNCFETPKGIIYIRLEDFLEIISDSKEIFEIEKQINEFKHNPKPEGKVISVQMYGHIELFIPNLISKEPLDKGDNIWARVDGKDTCYCILSTELWRGKNYSFYSNTDCECFPCHKAVKFDEFNCLFCYCPLYALGDRCGGNFFYYGDIKDCSECIIPHKKDNYGHIINRYKQIITEARKNKQRSDIETL